MGAQESGDILGMGYIVTAHFNDMGRPSHQEDIEARGQREAAEEFGRRVFRAWAWEDADVWFPMTVEIQSPVNGNVHAPTPNI